MSEVPFDDPAGRTRFAWARTVLVAFVVSLLVERLYFSGSPWSVLILAVPLITVGIATLFRSRPLRFDPQGFSARYPGIVLASVLVIAISALVGVALR